MSERTAGAHYRVGGYECIEVVTALGLNFNLGNAMKYLWRAGRKTADPAEDLQKAREYIDFELARLAPPARVAPVSQDWGGL